MLWRCSSAVAAFMVAATAASIPLPPSQQPSQPPPIDPCDPSITNPEAEEVFVVFSNHLDVGYDIDGNPGFGYSADIINKYMNEYIPTALNTAQQFASNPEDKKLGKTYTWMGFSFLFDILFHCKDTVVNIEPGVPSNLACPNSTVIAEIEEAIRRGPTGGITWQAFPHNAEPEMYTPEFFEVALNTTHRLDDTYGRPRRITYSQRDVPGLTRAALPLLNKHGVTAITVGENFAPRAIAVLKADEFKKWPTKIFKWIDPVSKASAITLLHPHGYGDMHACDCVYVEAAKTALCFAWKQDNTGPHSYQAAVDILQTAQTAYPNATVRTSDGFDDFIRKITPFEDTLLRIDYEIGDSWVFGSSADPIKASTYRAVIRARTQCVKDGLWDADAVAERTFDRLILKLGEHTWGSSGANCKTLPFDNPSFRASGAYPMAANSTQKNGTDFDPYCVNTWYEQRMWVLNAVDALKTRNAKCYDAMEAELSAISPEWEKGVWPIQLHTPEGYDRADGSVIKTNSGLVVEFNDEGGIIALSQGQNGSVGHIHATAEHPLVQFRYQTVSGNDTIRWVTAYGAEGGAVDNANMGTNLKEETTGDSIGATGYVANASLMSIWVKSDVDKITTSILVFLDMPLKGHLEAGSPRRLTLQYTIAKAPGTKSGFNIDIELHTLDKSPTKHKETGWLSFRPPFGLTTKLEIDKLGSWIDPQDVIPINGSNMHMHGIHTGVRWSSDLGVGLSLESLDAAVISVGDATPVPTTAINGDPLYNGGVNAGLTPDSSGGVHFSLFNNIWNTNYPFWYPWQVEDRNTKYRFRLTAVL